MNHWHCTIGWHKLYPIARWLIVSDQTHEVTCLVRPMKQLHTIPSCLDWGWVGSCSHYRIEHRVAPRGNMLFTCFLVNVSKHRSHLILYCSIAGSTQKSGNCSRPITCSIHLIIGRPIRKNNYNDIPYNIPQGSHYWLKMEQLNN